MSEPRINIHDTLAEILANQRQILSLLTGNEPAHALGHRRPDVGSSIHPRTCACHGSGWLPADDPTMPGTTVAAECPGTDSDIAPIVTLADAKAHLDRVRATRRHPTNPQEPSA